jgi:thiamine biosynthesis lipoprotein
LYAAEEASANKALRAAFARIATLDQALTNYDAASELNQLCRSAPHAQGVAVSDDLWRVLRAADCLSRLSDGAFDVTVGPLTQLWRRARRRQELPEDVRLRAALQSVGHHLISFDEQRRTVRLTRANMQLDLGGIAKGYAVDEALRVIADQGIHQALVNGGGGLAVTAPPPGKVGWRIDMAVPEGVAIDHRQVEIHHAAVATSGDSWQYVDINGTRYSHILDPRTGLGMTHRSLVTVVAPTGMLADGLATAVSVMGARLGIPLIETQAGVEAVVYDVNQDKWQRQASRGFNQLLVRE